MWTVALYKAKNASDHMAVATTTRDLNLLAEAFTECLAQVVDSFEGDIAYQLGQWIPQYTELVTRITRGDYPKDPILVAGVKNATFINDKSNIICLV